MSQLKQPHCVIRSQTGLHYPSGALVAMGFWEYFLKSRAEIFRSKSINRFILNRYMKNNSRNWATQDVVANITQKVNHLIKTHEFTRREGFYRRYIPLYKIEDHFSQAKARAEMIELHYRDLLSNPVPMMKYNSELARILYNQPKRYSSDPNLMQYFDVGDFQ